MTEEQWLTCDDPHALLNCIGPRASERKLRLFAVACCRVCWPLLRTKQMRPARQLVKAAENYAEGEVTEEEMVDAARSVRCRKAGDDAALVVRLASAAAFASDPHVGYGTLAAAQEAARITSSWATESGLIVPEVQASLLRDIFSFSSQPQPVPRSCFDWRDGLVLVTAQESYRARDFGELPVLADMLEDAGCTNESILTHLRSAGPHVRGCWVLDLILGKE